MLPTWDPHRLVRKIPFNLGLVGGRRQGKSCACSHLVQMMRSKFDLVIAFIGSAAANPVLHQLMHENWDPRFFFSEWNTNLVECLLQQQEDAGPLKRNILILVDDVVLTGKDEDQLSHLAMRGRHFGISLMMCAVSYTSLPKKARRSLDALLVFSLPMQGDLKILLYEYASQNSMAEHALKNLPDHCSLVLETLEKKQQLYIWKADLLVAETALERESQGREISRSGPSSAIRRVHQTDDRQTDTACPESCTRSEECETERSVRVV